MNFDSDVRLPGYPALNAVQLTALGCELHTETDAARRRILVGRIAGGCARLVAHACRSVGKLYPGHPEWEDCVQACYVEVAAHAGGFDPTKGANAATYCKWWIDSAVFRHLKKRPLVAGTAWARGLSTATAEKRAYIAAARAGMYPVDPAEAGLLGPVIQAHFATPDAGPEDMLCRSDETDDARRRIQAALARIRSARTRGIIEQCYLSDPPATLETAGAPWGISRERVRQILDQAMPRFALLLGAPGVTAKEIRTGFLRVRCEAGETGHNRADVATNPAKAPGPKRRENTPCRKHRKKQSNPPRVQKVRRAAALARPCA